MLPWDFSTNFDKPPELIVVSWYSGGTTALGPPTSPALLKTWTGSSASGQKLLFFFCKCVEECLWYVCTDVASRLYHTAPQQQTTVAVLDTRFRTTTAGAATRCSTPAECASRRPVARALLYVVCTIEKRGHGNPTSTSRIDSREHVLWNCKKKLQKNSNVIQPKFHSAKVALLQRHWWPLSASRMSIKHFEIQQYPITWCIRIDISDAFPLLCISETSSASKL